MNLYTFLIVCLNTAQQRLIISNTARVKSRLAADRKPWDSTTIDVTFGRICGYIGLKGLKRRHIRPNHDKRN